METKEIEYYRGKLSGLLDNCAFFKSDISGEVMTPRAYFEEGFEQLVTAPIMFFRNIGDEVDNIAAGQDLKLYSKHGGGAKGAYEVIKEELMTLQSATLDIANDAIKDNGVLLKFTLEGSQSAKGVHYTIKSDDLLGMERGLIFLLKETQESLSVSYGGDDERSTREVLEERQV